jgi:hypothetical protein
LIASTSGSTPPRQVRAFSQVAQKLNSIAPKAENSILGAIGSSGRTGAVDE